jgi:hypothetical protein
VRGTVKSSRNPPEGDFVSKHGKRVVAILFSILVGDAVPTIVEHGLKPNETFYTIVLVTMPYTAALVIILLALARSSDNNPYTVVVGSTVVFMLLFGLAVWAHWGITDAEALRVSQEMEQISQVRHGAPRNPIRTAANDMGVLLKFYFTKYGIALFVSATLAAFVVTWNILKWHDGRRPNA